MADRVQLTFWNYNQFENYQPHMLEDWINLGMTTPITPSFGLNSSEELYKKFYEMLDDAHSRGVGLILQIPDIYLWSYHDRESFIKTALVVKEKFGSHPAVAGFYVGEEPHGDAQEYFEGVKTLKEIFPDKIFYMNMGSIERTERCALKGRESITNWCCRYTKETGSNIIGYGCYAGMLVDGTGLYEHFHNIREFVEAGKKAGADIWATMLSSVHDFYKIPTADDFRWQLNTCVACGCKGIVWFRIYDKLVAGDYRESPIDEFGNKTTHYYDLARIQNKFNILYGEIFARLNHKYTYGIGVSYGGYPYYTTPNECACDYIAGVSGRMGMVSTFVDDDGVDYCVLINTDPKLAGHLSLTFTDKVEKVEEVFYNGKQLDLKVKRNGQQGNLAMASACYAPGQMSLFKITKVKE